MELLTERYSAKIKGVLSCYDRIVINGTIPEFNYEEAITGFFNHNKISLFDYPRIAMGWRDIIRENAEKIAQENGIEIEFLRKADTRKEDLVQKVIKKRSAQSGLVHILSAMEACTAYRPWHDKRCNRNYLRRTSGKCLHFYFYFIDETLGLCYVRVPTWSPFRLQIYFNGHNWLASQMNKKNISYELADNVFLNIGSFDKAQRLLDDFRVEPLHRLLDRFAKQYCPIINQLNLTYHWSIMQVEYATDIIFKRQADLKPIYEHLTRTAIHTIKPDHIATFLGRKIHGLYQDEFGNNFNTRIEGTRIKHAMGPVAIKMYDKYALVLRIETTVHNVSFFKHYREVVQRDGRRTQKVAVMKKNIYSLFPLRRILADANHRYLVFISSIEDRSAGIKNLTKISKSVQENGRPYKGFNLFSQEDHLLFQIIASGEFTISGFQNKNLRSKLICKSTGQISRLLKRLITHGLIKRIRNTYKYYLTHLGHQLITTALKLKELFIIPQLCYQS